MKKSANVGNAIKVLEKDEELTNDQLAFDLNLSPQMVSHMKNDRRVMQQDIARESVAMYDNPRYTMEILHEFSDGFAVPMMDGKAVDWHRLSLLAMLKKQFEEALEALKEVDFTKPPQAMEKHERELMVSAFDEILDARLSLENWLIQLQEDYNISIKKRMKVMTPRWKARGWLQ
ncbi:hypothetical protein [Rummeliibacillus sp. TYF-LIM-RU47]|uniref:hypothetical protein n=1 Tax=Rummeliibacillus sp. TYF-LIM-RU47 TaxID=2608406 RepID=UPI00123BF87B|nr:hypothetical protein [Rummeliibacillus sp. TYF-LIM-RU47]